MRRLVVPQLVNWSLTTFDGTNQPMSIQVRKAPVGNRKLAVSLSQKSMMLTPMSCRLGTAPTDREQRAAMTTQTVVTMRAARLRGNWNSSLKKTVPISCMEMVEVRAANAKSA